MTRLVNICHDISASIRPMTLTDLNVTVLVYLRFQSEKPDCHFDCITGKFVIPRKFSFIYGSNPRDPIYLYGNVRHSAEKCVF